MNLQAKIFNQFLDLDPNFQKTWEDYIKYWDYETPGLCTDFSALADYVTKKINDNDFENIEKIFKLIERLLEERDSEIEQAITICFIENLQNYIRSDELDYQAVSPFLGPNTLKAGKELDQFWGGKETPGFE